MNAIVEARVAVEEVLRHIDDPDLRGAPKPPSKLRSRTRAWESLARVGLHECDRRGEGCGRGGLATHRRSRSSRCSKTSQQTTQSYARLGISSSCRSA